MSGNGAPCGPVLVVDDDHHVRTLIAALLAEAGLETAEAASAAEAVAALDAGLAPALAVLDVHLPGGASGYELCRTLRERYGDEVPVLFVSGERTEPYDRVAGFLIGGDDYLTKPFAPDELVARCRALLRRSHAPVPRFGLTPREYEILRLLATGLPQKRIAAELVISPKTVGTHIDRILGKLGVHSRAEAVSLAFREGLVRM